MNFGFKSRAITLSFPNDPIGNPERRKRGSGCPLKTCEHDNLFFLVLRNIS
jgi:hypothetical protein